MLGHFHNRLVVKAIRYIYIYAETIRDKWKQTPYPIWLLRRCDSKSSNGKTKAKSLEKKVAKVYLVVSLRSIYLRKLL